MDIDRPAGLQRFCHRPLRIISRHRRHESWLDRLWGSIFSFQGGKFFAKWPKEWPYRVTVAFGKPLDAQAADIPTVREELLKLGEFCYSSRSSLDRHLGEACVRGLKRHRFRTAVIDGIDGSELTRAPICAS